MMNEQHKKQIFEEETMQALRDLGEVLRPIYERMIADGYAIVDGKFQKIDTIKWS